MKKNYFYPSIRFMNLLILLLFFAGCSKKSDDDNKPDKKGEFTIKITGSETSDYKGEATFTHSMVREGVSGFSGSFLQIIFGFEDDNTFFINLSRKQIEHFQKGKYIYIGDSDDDVPLIISSMFYSSKNDKIYFITNGFVDLEKVENTLLKGNFKFDYMSSDEKKISISGSFSASGITSAL